MRVFGHIMMCKYFAGFLLMGLELLINVKTHLNLAILDTMLGEFDKAKLTIDLRRVLLYVGVYGFAIRDSYRVAIEVNELYMISDRTDAPIVLVKISALELKYLSVRNWRDVVIWSFLCPGAGHLYINRLPTGFFILGWYLLVFYQPNLSLAILATCHGQFVLATTLIDPEWLLFFPSICGFSAHDSYLQAIDLSKLFKSEQSRFLSERYQSRRLKLSTLLTKVDWFL
jgi:hypothetical protein